MKIFIKLLPHGSGFTTTSITNFQTLIENLSNSIENKNLIKKIVVCGGYNDYQSNYNTIVQAIRSFVNYCKTTFPNAKVYLGFIAWQANPSAYLVRQNLLFNVLRAYQYVSNVGGFYLNGVEYVMHDYNNISDDNVHPTNVGSEYLGKAITNALITGYSSYTITPVTINLNGLSGQITILNNLLQLGLSGVINYTENPIVLTNRSANINFGNETVFSRFMRFINSTSRINICCYLNVVNNGVNRVDVVNGTLYVNTDGDLIFNLYLPNYKAGDTITYLGVINIDTNKNNLYL